MTTEKKHKSWGLFFYKWGIFSVLWKLSTEKYSVLRFSYVYISK